MKKQMKTWKKVLIVVLCVFLFISIGGYVAYEVLGSKVVSILFAGRPGNSREYNLNTVEPKSDSPLQGKTILFLGSSVTEGYGSAGVTFAEYLERIDGIHAVKETKSGTTLVTVDETSYIPRMETMDTSIHADAFICQLSTNDATQALPLGVPADSKNRADFDTSTVAGSIEYIISYATETWNCPVIFYTGTHYDSENYAAMVDLLLELQEKWGIGVIDLWNNEELNAVTEEEHALYMIDDVHPTKAGYLLWWTPVFQNYLYDWLG